MKTNLFALSPFSHVIIAMHATTITSLGKCPPKRHLVVLSALSGDQDDEKGPGADCSSSHVLYVQRIMIFRSGDGRVYLYNKVGFYVCAFLY